MRKTMILAGLLFAAACSPATRMANEVRSTGVAYDTVRDGKVAGLYRAQGVYDTAEARKGNVTAEEVRWRALYNGLQAVQKDGYETATVAGPAGMTLNRTVTSKATGTTTTTNVWPGFAYVIQGYRKGDAAPPAAKPIAQLMDDADRRAVARR
jgi:hypothetical protein